MHPNDGRVVSNFIIQALSGADLTVYGKGNQTRSFCYVDDLITGLVKFMNSPDPLIGPINLGNPAEITILELAEKILAMTKSPAKIVFKPLPTDDPIQRQPNITLAKQHFGWEPRVSLDEGLERTIAYFKDLLRP
jgi:UDP-glucuronate decarboxylase